MMDSESGDLVAFLRHMVSFDTINSTLSGNPRAEEKLIAFLEEQTRRDGFSSRRFGVEGQSDQLLIEFEPNPGGPWLLFDSHVDTVPVVGMTIDPFEAEIRDGKVWGRGAADTKGSGAAMYTALKGYKAGGGREMNVALLYSIDEESGMRGIRAFTDIHLAALGYSFSGAVVGEPTNLRVVIAHNGVARYLVSTTGLAAHSSDPARGRSAVSLMARLILYLEEEYIPTITASHPLTGRAQSSINVIRGGSAVNIIPDICEIHVDRRTVPGENPAEVVESFHEAVDVFGKRHTEGDVGVEVTLGTPPLVPSEDLSWAKAAGAVLVSCGLDGTGIGVKYATHAGFLSAAGIPSVVLGPGDVAQAHVKDEWIDIRELERSVSVYRGIMEMVAAGL